MPFTKRDFLKLAGGGTVLAATPAAVFLATRTPHRALEPWNEAGTYSDMRMNALSYGLLAPNPHNRQPWEAELIGTDGLRLWRDPERDLPVTDPFNRQLTIGMGCFLELMTLAANQQGFDVQTSLFPNGENGPVAECIFVEGKAKPDPLFSHVLERRSHKEAFEAKPVPDELVIALSDYAQIHTSGESREVLRRLAHDAWMMEVNTPAALQESVDLLRIGKAEIEAKPDGIDLGGPLMDSLALVGMLDRNAAMDLENPGTKGAIEDTANAISSAPAFTLTKTPGNSRTDQIQAGRQWLRFNLATTQAGLALRPVSQALQEYAEMTPLYEEMHGRFATNGETIQMFGLLGYGDKTARTPRWPLQKRMRNA